MGVYKYIQKIWRQPKANLGDVWKNRLIQWRKEPVTVRLKHPTRIDRARSLGYKAKQGYFVVRQKVLRGGHRRLSYLGGRRPRHNSKRLDLDKSYQQISEERVCRKYINCEALNSYWVASDGHYHWFEVIMVDRAHPVIKKDMPWINKGRNRAARGKTSSGKKGRGLMNKGKGAEKLRPSKSAAHRRKVN